MKMRSLLLLGAFGLFAASCGESTDTETTYSDTAAATTTAPDLVTDTTVGTMGAGSATGGMADTTDTTSPAR
ncbi:MAG: hypothetical protein K0R82_1134 [Flavipsychrobacter sp.]|jgi:hypothetical protein|nr:hypothetical protein [Flavipsychrobacter sp.]